MNKLYMTNISPSKCRLAVADFCNRTIGKANIIVESKRVGDRMLPTIQELEQMKVMDIQTAEKENLIDLRDISIDINQNLNERVVDYLDKIKNPFLVKIGDYVVKFTYTDTEDTINDRMKLYLSKMTEIRY